MNSTSTASVLSLPILTTWAGMEDVDQQGFYLCFIFCFIFFLVQKTLIISSLISYFCITRGPWYLVMIDA